MSERPTVAPTRHAVLRYRERVKPAFRYAQARDELVALVEVAVASMSVVTPDPGDDVELAPGIWGRIALDGDGAYVVASVLTHCGWGEEIRTKRRKAKYRARAAKAGRRNHRDSIDRKWAKRRGEKRREL